MLTAGAACAGRLGSSGEFSFHSGGSVRQGVRTMVTAHCLSIMRRSDMVTVEDVGLLDITENDALDKA